MLEINKENTIPKLRLQKNEMSPAIMSQLNHFGYNMCYAFLFLYP